MMRSRVVPFVSFLVLVGLGGLVYAAGVGAPARGIPFSGHLERDGNPVSETDVPFLFRIFDGAESTGEAELYAVATTVDVNAGKFTVVLGRDTTALPNSVFDAAELFVQVEVNDVVIGNRQQIWALPQAVRAGEATGLNLRDGMIFNGAPHAASGTDLGLYSSDSGKYIRLTTNDGRVRIHSDGATSDGYGSVADLEVTATATTARNNVVVGNQVSSASANIGATTVSTLQVTDRAFGAPFSPQVNSAFTMGSDAFVTFDVFVNAGADGPRAKIEIFVNGAGVATDSVHKFEGTDAFVPHGSCATAVRRGDTVELRLTPSSGNANQFTTRTRAVPFGL